MVSQESIAKPAKPLRLTFLVFIFLVAISYPFEWLGPNHAELSANGAAFRKAGIMTLRSSEYFEWLQKTIETGELSLALTARSLQTDQQGPARILTISLNAEERNLTVGQEGPDLILRIRRIGSTLNGLPAFVVPDVFSEPQTRDIAIAVREGNLSLWVDGELKIDAILAPESLTLWDESYALALGNEFTSNRPWLGEISGAALAAPSRSFDLLSLGVLDVPFTKNSFALFSKSRDDLFANFFAFVIIGLLTLTSLSRPSPILVAILWAPICIGGEVAQLFLLDRTPQVSDFVLNILGAYAGGHLALFAAKEVQTS